MLEGIETGYEERYDFPRREALPDRAYMIATVPRTGSSYFSHELWRTGCLGAPLEYLNFVPTGPARFATTDPHTQTQLWREMLHVRTSPNGVFGLKTFSIQLRELQQRNPALLREVFDMLLPPGSATRVVRLKRRDRLAHAISYARALMSGVWRKEQEGGAAPGVEYSNEAVDSARAYLDRQEADWDLLFRELGIDPLELWYEDILDRPDEAVKRVADYLAVTLDPGAAVPIYQVEKQSEEDSRRWKERYQGGSRD